MHAGNLRYEEFEVVLGAYWGVAAETLPLPQLQRHLVDWLKGADPELAAKVAALYGDRFLQLAEEIKQARGSRHNGGGAEAPQ